MISDCFDFSSSKSDELFSGNEVVEIKLDFVLGFTFKANGP